MIERKIIFQENDRKKNFPRKMIETKCKMLTGELFFFFKGEVEGHLAKGVKNKFCENVIQLTAVKPAT